MQPGSQTGDIFLGFYQLRVGVQVEGENWVSLVEESRILFICL